MLSFYSILLTQNKQIIKLQLIKHILLINMILLYYFLISKKSKKNSKLALPFTISFT